MSVGNIDIISDEIYKFIIYYSVYTEIAIYIFSLIYLKSKKSLQKSNMPRHL